MTPSSAFIVAVVTLVALYSIWRATRTNVNNVVMLPMQKLAPIIHNISISSDQEKQFVGREFPIIIIEPSMSPVTLSITRESTGAHINATFERPPTGLVTMRIPINQGEFLRAPLLINVQIKWTSEVSTSVAQVTSAPRRWW